MNSRRRALLLAALVLALLLAQRCRRSHDRELRLSDWFEPRMRPDVVTTTAWLAPVVWEGTFNRQALEKFYRGRNLTVGLAVFAPGRFVDQSLQLFLRLADAHFMAGHRVIFYVMSDGLVRLPELQLGPLRSVRALQLGREPWRGDLHLWRMQSLGAHIVDHIGREVHFLFSVTADQQFQGHVGVETLGASVAQLHGWWYFRRTRNFPYERRPHAAAYIPFGQGDFYYDGALVGGTPQRLLDLVEAYLQGVVQDWDRGLNSTYERHLNKYFFLHKPAKLLSPEYGWDTTFSPPPQVHYVKVAQHPRRDW
ncbi:putative glycosyltransferase 6 domain-containing protein 1 [Lepus europaeus]|uniref:putative glycosyltransferase 6 domain-containing protein 1 n=1 Tax=Lepus europaeus TaxID=9983 RepID=UPI002B45EC74|nr:putative glycosyltransferase 6 domain-containing protein 1 [Lepus europaeus]